GKRSRPAVGTYQARTLPSSALFRIRGRMRAQLGDFHDPVRPRSDSATYRSVPRLPSAPQRRARVDRLDLRAPSGTEGALQRFAAAGEAGDVFCTAHRPLTRRIEAADG